MFTILIPSDFSKNATNAIRYALQLTKKMPCKLVFFHGEIIPAVGTSEIPFAYLEFDREASQKQFEKYTSTIVKTLKIKIDPKNVSHLMTEGFSAAPLLLDAADKTAADLIIMGARGATGMRKILFGSTAADVIAKSKVPVLAVPESYIYSPVKKMLHASDLKNLKNELSMVLPFAKLFNATLEVAHITDTSMADAKLITRAQSEVKRRSYKKMKLYVEAITFGQNISRDIKQLTQRHHPDMLIMFRHEHNWLGRLFFTSRTENLVYESRIPILAFNIERKSSP